CPLGMCGGNDQTGRAVPSHAWLVFAKRRTGGGWSDYIGRNEEGLMSAVTAAIPASPTGRDVRVISLIGVAHGVSHFYQLAFVTIASAAPFRSMAWAARSAGRRRR